MTNPFRKAGSKKGIEESLKRNQLKSVRSILRARVHYKAYEGIRLSVYSWHIALLRIIYQNPVV